MSFLKRVTLLSRRRACCAPLRLRALRRPLAAPSGGLVEVVVTLDAKPLARGGDLRTLEAAQRSVESELGDRIRGFSVQHRYSTVLDGLAVSLPASELAALESADGVVRVYPNVGYRALRSSSPGFIGAPALWGPTLSSAGNGVKIGIIDDGLDKTHPYFSARGYRMPPGFPKGQKGFTSAKVIVARAFPPPTPKWKYGKRPFDPTPFRPRDARRRASRRATTAPGAGQPDLRRRAEGLHRELQGAHGAERVRAQRELAGDRRRHRGCGARRDGRDQPLARRGGDRAEPRHRRRGTRRRGGGGGRAGRGCGQQLRGARRRLDRVAGKRRPRDHRGGRERARRRRDRLVLVRRARRRSRCG